MEAIEQWPKSPYKGLSYYTPLDVALFGGRAADVRSFAREVARESTKVLLLHGPTACGKSSFLRAGLIPFLESEVGRFQFLRTFEIESTKALFVRCTDQPLYRLCETIFEFSEKPLRIDPPDAEPETIDLRAVRKGINDVAEFIEKNGRSVDGLISVLDALNDLLPKTLVLVIDQAEEVLSLKPGIEGQPDRELFFDFIAAVSQRSLDLKFIVALRTEYYGVFSNDLKKRDYDRTKLIDHLLGELTYEQLIQAVRIPTATNIPQKYLQGRCQPADWYNFKFEEGLPERIVADLLANRLKGGVLPILQIVCERLYKKTVKRGAGGKKWQITARDYELLGAAERQIDDFVNETLLEKIDEQQPKLSVAEREEELARWRDLLYELVAVEADNRALTNIRSERYLQDCVRRFRCKVDFTTMMAFLSDPQQRILRAPERRNDALTGRMETYYSLGHDAIAVELSKWWDTRYLVTTRRSFAEGIVRASIRGFATVFLFFGFITSLAYLQIDETDSLPAALIAFVIMFYLVIFLMLWFIANRVSRGIVRVINRFPWLKGMFRAFRQN